MPSKVRILLSPKPCSFCCKVFFCSKGKSMNKEDSFYKDGLKFSCKMCSYCCRAEPGFVYLSRKDLDRFLKVTNAEENEFIEKYCRWVPYYEGKDPRQRKHSINVFYVKEGIISDHLKCHLTIMLTSSLFIKIHLCMIIKFYRFKLVNKHKLLFFKFKIPRS